jgi:hypothetical protein
MSTPNQISVELHGKLGNSLRVKTKSLESVQTARVRDGSTNSQKDSAEVDFGCCSLKVLTELAVLLFGSFK